MVRLFWASEMKKDMAEGARSARAPDIASLWSILDLTPARGRGTDWYPKLSY